jgi:hypothetical protein
LLNSGKESVDLRNIIGVNKGVGQGRLNSPTQFNVFIDDLLDETSNCCFSVFAFADDTAFLYSSMDELLKIIGILDSWCEENEMIVNKSKSWVLVINDDGKDPSIINSYPVVHEYKYLGPLLNKMFQ